MSLLGGYDFALEFAQPIVRDLLLLSLRLDGQPLRPNTELSRPLKASLGGIQIAGVFHCIIDDVDVDIGNAARDTIVTVTARFSQGSIRTNLQSLCPLRGAVTLTIPLVIDLGPTSRIVADLPNAQAAVTFDQGSIDRLNATLGAFGLTAADLAASMTNEVASSIKAVGRQPVGNQTFELTPGTNGSFSGSSPAFTEAALACVFDPDRSKQALVLLGILLVSKAGQGNPRDKTRSIPDNRNIAISLSAAAFRTCLLCPAVANALQLPLGTAAPGVCGGSPATANGVTIIGFTDRMVSGAIEVGMAFTNSGFCHTVNGDVPITLRPDVSGGQLNWKATAGQPTVTLSIPWYCYLASFFIHPIITALLAIFDVVADGIATSEARSRLGGLLDSIELDRSSPFTVEEVVVAEEGLTLASTRTVQLPSATQPRIGLRDIQEIVQSEQVAQGETVLPAPCAQDLTHTWSEKRQWLRRLLVVEATLYGRPITTAWELVGADGVPFTLNNGSGAAQIPVDATYQTASTTVSIRRAASIQWSAAPGNQGLILRNDPADGNYTIQVNARLSNCAGTLQRVLVHHVAFDGHILEEQTFGGSALQECIPQWVDQFELPYEVLRLGWRLPIEPSSAGRLFTELSTINSPAAYSLAQTIPMLLATELRTAILRVPPPQELEG